MIEFIFSFGFRSFFIIFGLVVIVPIIILTLGGIMLLFGASKSKSAKDHDEKIQASLRDEISMTNIEP